jgi:hypothetical protein
MKFILSPAPSRTFALYVHSDMIGRGSCRVRGEGCAVLEYQGYLGSADSNVQVRNPSAHTQSLSKIGIVVVARSRGFREAFAGFGAPQRCFQKPADAEELMGVSRACLQPDGAVGRREPS